MWLDEWKREQRLFDEFNDNFPKRYWKDLEDRCRCQDATLPGSQKKSSWPGE
jgi:hypothetical protein